MEVLDQMARMIGDKLLPETVQSRRRQLRERVRSLRDPIQQRRQDLVPGPDVIGRIENMTTDIRDKFVQRDGVVSRIRSRRNSGSGGSSGNGSSNNNSQNANVPSDSMT